MFEALFGSELPLALRFFIAFLFVLGLIGGAAYLVRRFGAGALSTAAGRGRQPRLGVIESAPVDGRRRLVIIRRDNVEHLVMIGGPSDVVVETNIVRAASAGAGRDSVALRSAPEPMRPAAEPMRPAPEPMRAPPEPMRPAPEPMRAPPEPMRTAPEPMRSAPEPMRSAPEPMMRPAAAADTAMWPLQPEPVSRPQRQPMDEPAWTSPVTEPAARGTGAERLAGLAADLSRASPGDYGNARTPADYAPTRGADYAPARPVNEGRRAAATAQPVPPAPPPASLPPAPPLQAPSTDEQNLADMAHRLEAALRRPTGPMAAADMGVNKPMPMDAAPPRHAPVEMPRPVPEPKADKVQDFKPPEPKPHDLRPQGSKSVYDSLEQEMASLLGRPSGKP